MNAIIPQWALLLNALSDKKAHTVPELLQRVYGLRGPSSARIASRIHELRSIHGWKINTEKVAGTVWSYQLIGPKKTSTSRYGDLSNRVFGRLTVKEYVGTNKFGAATWLCLCSCGKERIAIAGRLRNGETKSCGCLASANRKTIAIKHGLSNSILYKKWESMKSRCENPATHNYKRYGGRGIKILWPSFEAFYADMHEAYQAHAEIHGAKNTTIERINNDGNYCKENCKWATTKEQNANKSNRIGRSLRRDKRGKRG